MIYCKWKKLFMSPHGDEWKKQVVYLHTAAVAYRRSAATPHGVLIFFPSFPNLMSADLSFFHR